MAILLSDGLYRYDMNIQQ